MTVSVRIDVEDPNPECVAQAGEVLARGGLVVLPTDTVYGLAANAFNQAAVAKLFEIKGRRSDKPLAVLVADPADVAAVAKDIPEWVRHLMGAFFPGPLTVILPKSPKLPDVLTAGGPTVGVRCPDLELTRDIIRACGSAIAATSANLSGGPSPIRDSDVPAGLVAQVDMIVNGGDCPLGVESTVLDVTVDPPQILREGAVGREIAAALAASPSL